MATRQEAREAREAKLDELHEKLTGAVEQLVSGADWARALAFAARLRSRSFNNATLIWLQHMEAFEAGRVPGPFPSYVAGYKQWQQLGRQVEKGQPGYQILAPVTGRFAGPHHPTARVPRRTDQRRRHRIQTGQGAPGRLPRPRRRHARHLHEHRRLATPDRQPSLLRQAHRHRRRHYSQRTRRSVQRVPQPGRPDPRPPPPRTEGGVWNSNR
ncbi:ArdC family protein [Desertihabitans brevis]|uniref:ArdC family protein n=1 Tax=Desertihabitans brevis TaxID=2268447 RepID=UPI001EEA1B03|nr:ArdC family protein [Desertihabitans brevis]